MQIPLNTKTISFFKKHLTTIIFLWSAAMLLVCIKTEIRHDHGAYLEHWTLLLDGKQPWSKTNAYGPLYILIGYVLPLGRLAPKILMTGTLLLANGFLLTSILKKSNPARINLIYIFAIPTNFLVVGIGVIYGLNDTPVATLLLVAVLLKIHKHESFAGIAIASAGLIKFYPILLLPFFAQDEKKFSWHLMISGTLTFSIGFIVANIIWDNGPMNAIIFGSSREATLLSLLEALHNIFKDNSVIETLIKYNSHTVIVSAALAFLFVRYAALSWLEGTILSYLVILLTYKVGHQQFYLPWLFLIACLPLMEKKSAYKMGIIFLPITLTLSLYQMGYALTDYVNEWQWIRSYGGLPYFLMSSACIAIYAKETLTSPRL